MSRILVTGSTGFLGRPLVAALAAAGHEVRALSRRADATWLPPSAVLTPAPDFNDPIDWTQLLAGIEVVVHLAGISDSDRCGADDAFDRVIHRATADLAAAAIKAGVKQFIYVSSVRAQSGGAADRVLTEAEEPHPTDAYGRAKLAAEAAVRASGVPFTILRPVSVYGPGAKSHLARLYRLAAKPLPLPFASFANKRSLLNVDNFVAAVLFVLDRPKAMGETYLVADPFSVTFADIVRALRAGKNALLFPFRRWLIAAAFIACGRRDLWNRFGGELVASPIKLMAAGWTPAVDTRAALARLAKGS